jgi:hypothetical protein
VRILELQEYPQLRNSLVELGANPNQFPESIPSSDAFEGWKEQTVLKAEERIKVINNQLPGSVERSEI